MIESFKERFLRKTPQGRPDVMSILRNLIGDPRSSNELPHDEYLASLSEIDKAKVISFIDYTKTLGQSLGVGLAITAVGSTVKQEAERHHIPEDIDLRVLNTASPESQERTVAIERIKDVVRDYFRGKYIPIDEENCTVCTRMVWGSSGGKEELLPFADWYNNDPSFIAKYPEGLPLQISISGVNNYDMRTYLRKEREHNARFALLYQTR